MRKNRLFSNTMMEILLDRRRWWLISLGTGREIAPVKNLKHERWMRTHSHNHNHTEIMFVLKGRGLLGYEKQAYPYAPGTIFCFHPGESHDLQIPEWGQETEMLWIVLMGRKFMAQVTQFRPDLPREDKAMGYVVLAKDSGLLGFDPLGDQEGTQRPEVRSLRLYAGVQVLISVLINSGDMEAVTEGQTAQRAVRMMQEHMEETGGQDLSPAELARMSGYSKTYFMRLFKDQAGCTVQEYLDQCRCRKAHELEGLGYKQFEIAARLGFSTPASYSRWRRQQEARGKQNTTQQAQEERKGKEVRARIL